MRKALLLLSCFLLAAACGGTASDSAPAPATVPPSAPVTDSRVGELQVLVNELLDRIEVLNARIQRLEAGTPAPTREQVDPAPVSAARPAVPAVATPLPPRRATSRPADPSTIGTRYQNALTLFGKGRINDARGEFEQVLQADSTGELADNALYWIAETYFVTGKYAEAMTYYKQIEADYSDQNKAPDAMLRMGEAQVKLGDLALAQRTLGALMEKYPYSTAAAAAKAVLARIKY